ncbi:hypothetical protein HWV07_07295 [Natronomonas salina]|uniref:hypothetical protein n=1 Tax=Natronomonas salina TaxID=1710540 RepID=UPI0015B50E57|nr:hypothetical protein [Natronomonas salina]QLD88845.1 hypothetical protein HWV07_07295 [Natronomonas salina]
MYDSKRTVAVLFVALTVVGLSIAPIASVAAPDDGSDIDQQTTDVGPSTQANESGPFPQEICTDLLGMAHEEMPYDQIVWVDDLPESAQPPGVPWTVITPSAVAGIVVGATPNQCDVLDPNDPPYDPIQDDEDNLAPDAGGDVQPGENGEVLFIVNGTLDNTSEGPSGVAEADLELTENGTIDPNARLNDGEKDYGVDPGLQYWSDGTTYFETDVFVFGSRVGVENDCFGQECNTRLRGLPTFTEIPALPSHTDRERPNEGGSDDGSSGVGNGTDDGTGSDDGSSGGTGTTGGDGSGTGSDGTTDSPDGAGDGGDGSSDDGGSGSNDGGGADAGGSDGNDGGDGGDGQNSGGDGGDAGGDENTGGAADQQQQSNSNAGNQGAQQAAAADGSGLGVVVALIVFVVGAAAVAPRD